MQLRAVIIDDEQRGINALKILIDKFVEEVKVVAESTNAYTGIDLIENYIPDIVFLDINMPEMNGFELLNKVKWKKFNLIFTTAYHEHGLKAIKNNAVGYLLKPIDYEELRAVIGKVRDNLNVNEENQSGLEYIKLYNNIHSLNKHKIVVNSKSGIESIDLSEIINLESKSNYTQISLADERTILTSKTLKEFDEQLCIRNLNFMRVHHSYIVNLGKVIRYLKNTENIVMANHQQIPLAKSRKSLFFEWLKI